jgi:uncharacterized protein DUF6502
LDRGAKGRTTSSLNTVMSAVESVFEPLAQLLVEHGISSPQAETLLRAVCVHQAAKIGGSRAKRPNVSRIALVTGIDRAEVSRILESPPAVGLALEARRNRANRVLVGWHSDPRFLDRDGPLVLPIKDEDRRRPSFWTLVNRYAPGVYPGLILSELFRVGAAEKLADQRVRARMRQYEAKHFSDEVLREMGTRVRDLLRTLLSNATEAKWPRIFRVVETLNVDARFLPLIRKMFSDRTEALLAGVQEELKSSRWRRARETASRVRIGLTVFSYEELRADRSNGTVGHDHPRKAQKAKSRRREAAKDAS